MLLEARFLDLHEEADLPLLVPGHIPDMQSGQPGGELDCRASPV